MSRLDEFQHWQAADRIAAQRLLGRLPTAIRVRLARPLAAEYLDDLADVEQLPNDVGRVLLALYETSLNLKTALSSREQAPPFGWLSLEGLEVNGVSIPATRFVEAIAERADVDGEIAARLWQDTITLIRESEFCVSDLAVANEGSRRFEFS